MGVGGGGVFKLTTLEIYIHGHDALRLFDALAILSPQVKRNMIISNKHI